MSETKRPTSETSFGRRGFLRTAAIAGTAVGVTALADTAQAMGQGLPRAGKRSHFADASIRSELGTVIEGRIDLLTLESGSDARGSEFVHVEFLLDSLVDEKSVRSLTDPIEKLALVSPELHRPETALLTWGRGFSFKGVIEATHTGFSMFLADGTPVRATVATTWNRNPREKR